jgi:hypothetical protein
MLSGRRVNPERDAAVLRRTSRETNPWPLGWEPHQIRAEANCRASAARSGWATRFCTARSRKRADGKTSVQLPDRSFKRSLVALSPSESSEPSLARREIAETHSTRVAHQTTISVSSSRNPRTAPESGSREMRGIIAEVSQNLTV